MQYAFLTIRSRLSELNPKFVNARGGFSDTECTLNEGTWPLYGQESYCRVRFPFSFRLDAFKTPYNGKTFGTTPLVLEAAFHALSKVPG